MNVKPRTLQWHPAGDKFTAPFALGTYSIVPKNDAWVPMLNIGFFPILHKTQEMAKTQAALAQTLYPTPAVMLDWTQDGTTARSESLGVTWEVVESQGDVQGWYILRDGQPPMLAFSQERAKEVCQEHLAVLWYGLSEPA